MPEDRAKEGATVGVADLDALRPTLARIARVAKTLFAAPLADIAIFQDGAVWRASDRLVPGADDPASAIARLGDAVLWVEDLTLDARFNSHPAVTGVPHLRFYAGAPITLENGERIGALAVYGLKQRPHDHGMAERLRDLADIVGHECDRVSAIAERARLLDQVKRQEERLEIAVESANLHVFEMDFVEQTLIKTGVPDTFYDTPQTFEGLARRPFDYIHPDDREAVKTQWRRGLEAGQHAPTEWRVNRADGEEVWVQASARMFRDEVGRPLRLVGSLQNISDRKRDEKAMAEAKAFAEAANVAKSVFLATMSHEIRTPLNGVLGMAQAMAADDLSPPQRDRLDVIRESGESLLAILNDLLDFSKIEAGKLEIESIEFDLAEICRGAHAAFSALAGKKGLEFTLDMDAAMGVYLGDPTRVRQILYNLISNALKFTSEGGVHVAAAYDGAVLHIEVADTGIGMTDETMKGLFSKFAQADASTSRHFGGTGLGLAICRELATLMGGAIAVTSEVGKGATFSIDLPLARVGDAMVMEERPATETDASAAPIRVLAAEDNSVNQLVLRTLLQQVGIEPTIVENGELAVAAWESGHWDVILMDVQMPVMDGPTAVRLIREREAARGARRTPIIALTANAMSHQVAEYRQAGMDGHLAKPIEAAKLFEVLGAVLDGADEEAVALRA
jgi:signal transduction histidine kinase/ActR/RegA family two-component response regulator